MIYIHKHEHTKPLSRFLFDTSFQCMKKNNICLRIQAIPPSHCVFAYCICVCFCMVRVCVFLSVCFVSYSHAGFISREQAELKHNTGKRGGKVSGNLLLSNYTSKTIPHNYLTYLSQSLAQLPWKLWNGRKVRICITAQYFFTAKYFYISIYVTYNLLNVYN